MLAEVANNTDGYLQLVKDAGPVIIAVVILGGGAYIIGKSVVVPSLRLFAEITNNLKEANIRVHDSLIRSERLTDLPRSTDALIVQVNRLESTATRLERVGG